MEGDRDREAGEDEVGGVVERVADRLRHSRTRRRPGCARASSGLTPIASTIRPAMRNAITTLMIGISADLDPARQRRRPALMTARARLRPARSRYWPSSGRACARRPRRPATSPTMRPPHITRMRSASDITSSSSTETSRMAQPASRIATSWRWMNSIAPMSTPRVGWPTSRMRGAGAISRASTSFCWLPPEKFALCSVGARGRTSKRSISVGAMVRDRVVVHQDRPLNGASL